MINYISRILNISSEDSIEWNIDFHHYIVLLLINHSKVAHLYTIHFSYIRYVCQFH